MQPTQRAGALVFHEDSLGFAYQYGSSAAVPGSFGTSSVTELEWRSLTLLYAVHLFGGASMGALRAAELTRHGRLTMPYFRSVCRIR